MPVDKGRWGGDKRVGERTGFGSWYFRRGGMGTGAGASDCVLLEGTASILRVAERRGGGSSGFGFSSESCISFADLKDAGDSGSFSLCTEVDTRRTAGVARFMSSDCGRTWREPRGGGGIGDEGVLVFNAASCTGFCLIGGDFMGSFCDVWK